MGNPEITLNNNTFECQLPWRASWLPRFITLVFGLMLVTVSVEEGNAQGTLGSLELATDPSFGANSLVIDTSTGLAWLNLNYTVNTSYNQVVAETRPNGRFAGFTPASPSQVLTLFEDGDIPGNGSYSLSSPVFQNVSTFISLIGSTGDENGYPYSIGLTSIASGPGLEEAAWLYVTDVNFVPQYNVDSPAPGIAYGTEGANSYDGTWLVMEIPEPEVWSMAFLGGSILMAGSRRFKT
jgi:hypothetical protein